MSYRRCYYAIALFLVVYVTYVHLKPLFIVKPIADVTIYEETPTEIEDDRELGLEIAARTKSYIVYEKTKFIRFPEVSDKRDAFLVILICSSADNFALREAVRQTWANKRSISALKHGTVQIYFVIGSSDDSGVTLKIGNESKVHNDILQYGQADTYDRLTLKTLHGLKWLNDTNIKPKFVMKCDDDVMLNIRYVIQELQKYYIQGVSNTIIGHVIANADPSRQSNQSKWFDINNGFKTYPRYASGSAYVITYDVIDKLFVNMDVERLFWLEDICITGILFRGVLHHDGRFNPQASKDKPLCSSFTLHQMTVSLMKEYWKQLNYNSRCDA